MCPAFAFDAVVVSTYGNIGLALYHRECQTNRAKSLLAAGPSQVGAMTRRSAGFAARESTIARARSPALMPSESSGADTAATIAPVRVSARRTCNQVNAAGSVSRKRNAKRSAA